MCKIIPVLLLFLLSGFLSLSAEDLPPVELEDQFGTGFSLREIAGDRTLALVYRARAAADDAQEHYRIARSYLDGPVTLVRIADLSRVPKLFREVALRLIKRDAGDTPYYIDLEGDDVEAFGVEENEVGFFYYIDRRLSASRKKTFTNKDDLRKDLQIFAAGIAGN